MAIEPLDEARLESVFFHYAQARISEARAKGTRFVYYTNADVAISILSRCEIWMRNASVMNDFSEISHGMDCLTAAYHGASGDVLNRALDAAHPGLSKEVAVFFDSWSPAIRLDTYMTCLSEHRGGDEDLRGRLAMWRAYGGTTGVAIVMKGAAMFSPSNALDVLSSPVFYGDSAAFAGEFMKVAKRVEAEVDFLKLWDRDSIKNAVFQTLRFAVLCTKHPGFADELEWRVIGSPTMHPSRRVSSVVEVVRGVPQIVLKIKLENVPEEGLVGLAPPELIDRIIIGPCEFPFVTHAAFYRLLTDLKVPDPQKKIFRSDIPLRHIG